MIKDAVDLVVKTILAEKNYLSELDAKIGDGDHGANMAMGAEAATEALDELNETELEDIQKVLQTIGEAFIMNVGGSSGPLYGAGIMAAANVVNKNSKLNIETLEKVFGAAVTEIQKRGRAVKGDKTMVDVLLPIYECFKAENSKGKKLDEVLIMARNAAMDGVEYTKTIAAKRGRASYLGDRSIGFEDPGAVSAYIIYKTLCGYWKDTL